MDSGSLEYRWGFHPRAVRESRPAEVEARRSALAAALRAGHGTGAAFALEMESGPAPALWLSTRDPATARWVARTLATAYEPHQWRRGGPRRPRASGAATWDARRVRAWPDPLRSGSDGPSILDGLALAFRALPPGVACRWEFAPVPADSPSWWEVEPPPRSVPVPSRPGRGVGSPTRDPGPPAPPNRPLFWRAGVSLGIDRSIARPELPPRAIGAIESASRGTTGNGLRCARRSIGLSVFRPAFDVSEAELTAVFPSGSCPVSGDADGAAPDDPGRLPLGRTELGTVIGPRLEAAQGRHLAVLGETGMGKSSLLVALARRVADRAGLIFFDPLGDTVRTVRDELGERARGRLIWIAPDAPARINALAGIGASSAPDDARADRQLDDLVHALRRVRSGRYEDSGFWGPRLEEMLTRSLRAAAAFPDGTLGDAHLLLASGGRGFRTVPPAAVDAVRELGDRMRHRPDDAEGARRLLYEVTRNPTLTRLLCERSPTLAAPDLVAPGRIALISGDAARVGESTARYLLAVYLALVWSELLARPTATKTFVLLDEAQWFVHESLSEMLRLGRRLNVHVVLTTQAVASLPEGVAQAVWTNVADFVAFRGAPEEAREFARIAPGVAADALLSLPRGAAAALIGKGSEVAWLRTARVPGASVRDSAPVPTTPVPPPPAGEEGGAVESISDAAPADGTREATVAPERVLDAIAARVEGTGAAGPVAVSLDELRAEIDPSGRAVRAAGSRLARVGAIVRTERTESGTRWWVDATRLSVERATRPPTTARTGSDQAQP